MKTITITAAEEKIILDALHSAKVEKTQHAKSFSGYTDKQRERLLNQAITNKILQHKIINSKKGRSVVVISPAVVHAGHFSHRR